MLFLIFVKIQEKVVVKDVYHALMDKGIFISIVSILPELGYKPSNQNSIFNKLLRIDKRIDDSYEGGYYIEWLSLLLIKAEFWLRVFLYNKDRYVDKNVLHDGLSFGKIITECSNAGMNSMIIKNLYRLNKKRVQYIHNYLKSGFDYDSIKHEKNNYELVVKELQTYCFETSLRILYDPDDIDNTVGFVRVVRLKTQ